MKRLLRVFVCLFLCFDQKGSTFISLLLSIRRQLSVSTLPQVCGNSYPVHSSNLNLNYIELKIQFLSYTSHISSVNSNTRLVATVLDSAHTHHLQKVLLKTADLEQQQRTAWETNNLSNFIKTFTCCSPIWFRGWWDITDMLGVQWYKTQHKFMSLRSLE